MPKRRDYRPSSPWRHQAKMERLILGKVTEETGIAMARSITTEWTRRYGDFNEAYRKMRQFLLSKHPDFPKGQLGLYRSFLFKALKEIPAGADPEALVDEFKVKCGLDPSIMYEILEYFGLYKREAEEEVVTKQG